MQLDPRNVKAREALMQYFERAPALLGGSRTKAQRQAAAIRGLEAFGASEPAASASGE